MSDAAARTAPSASVIKAPHTFCDFFRNPIPPSVAVYGYHQVGQVKLVYGYD